MSIWSLATDFGRSLFRRESAATREVLERSAAMGAALQVADAIYQPARFWLELMAENESMLRIFGVENFKRALSQNYFNFPIEHPEDPQLRALLATQDRDAPPPAVKLLGTPELRSVRRTAFLRSSPAAQTYARFVGLLWRHATRDDPEGLGRILSEPDLGNPVPLALEGRRISQDLANSLREYRRLQPYLKPTPDEPIPVLAEIGAGYGRLGYVARSVQRCRYWIFDIPPALAVAEWYFAHPCLGAKVFRWRRFSAWDDVAAELAGADVAIFSIDQLGLAPDASVRAFAAISALHEFRPEQVPFYLSLMGRKATEAIYTKNHATWYNDRDDLTFRSESLLPPAGWSTAFDRPDDVLQSFTEKLFVREGAE